MKDFIAVVNACKQIDFSHRKAALATVVGVLIEVPVMLLVVRAVNASKQWYEGAPARS